MSKLSYIIRSRIRDYKYDLDCCLKVTGEDVSERIRQDRVIIQELKKILTGKQLNILSYESDIL